MEWEGLSYIVQFYQIRYETSKQTYVKLSTVLHKTDVHPSNTRRCEFYKCVF